MPYSELLPSCDDALLESAVMHRDRQPMPPADDPLVWLEGEHPRPVLSRVDFQQQLDAIDREFTAVAAVVAETVQPVTAAFLAADTAAARAAIDADAKVGYRCLQLEDQCLQLLARQSPVAGDLRRVVSVLRSVADVQRSANLLSHVGQSLAWVHPPSLRPDLREMIAGLGRVSGMVFAGAVEAWRARDALAAVELQRLDDEVDLLQKSLLTQLHLGGETVEEAVSLALICRYYERFADHGVEIARQLAYVLTGDRPAPG